MKVGTMETSSNLLASSALMKPPMEKSAAVSTTTPMVSSGWATLMRVKKSDTMVTISPTPSPQAMPPSTKPERITQLGIGETIISSMERWNLLEKKEEATLE